jgi:hypothetical protein
LGDQVGSDRVEVGSEGVNYQETRLMTSADWYLEDTRYANRKGTLVTLFSETIKLSQLDEVISTHWPYWLEIRFASHGHYEDTDTIYTRNPGYSSGRLEKLLENHATKTREKK